MPQFHGALISYYNVFCFNIGTDHKLQEEINKLFVA